MSSSGNMLSEINYVKEIEDLKTILATIKITIAVPSQLDEVVAKHYYQEKLKEYKVNLQNYLQYKISGLDMFFPTPITEEEKPIIRSFIKHFCRADAEMAGYILLDAVEKSSLKEFAKDFIAYGADTRVARPGEICVSDRMQKGSISL